MEKKVYYASSFDELGKIIEELEKKGKKYRTYADGSSLCFVVEVVEDDTE